MGEEHGLWAMDKRVLRKVLGYKRDKYQGSGEDYIMSSFMACTHQIFFGCPHQKE
jgi:hypothetical protein